MKKFVVIYHAPDSFNKQSKKQSTKNMENGMQAWMAWANRIGNGLVDWGTPLANGQRLNKTGSATPSKKNVVGYSIIQAENMNQAKKMLKDHPHLKWAAGCEIEVHESMPMPGS